MFEKQHLAQIRVDGDRHDHLKRAHGSDRNARQRCGQAQASPARTPRTKSSVAGGSGTQGSVSRKGVVS